VEFVGRPPVPGLYHCIDGETTIQAFVVEAIREKLERSTRT